MQKDQTSRLMKKSVFKTFALFLIRGYQLFFSPIIGPCCRYFPSCSEYAEIAIDRYGFWKGSFLALKRLLRCHPFRKGGIDNVP